MYRLANLLAVIGLLSLPASGQTPPSPEELNRVQNQITKLVVAPASMDQAIAQIDRLWELDPARTALGLRNWLKNLHVARRYDLVDRWSLRACVESAVDPAAVEQFLNYRVRALLAAGKPDVALSSAKSFFNVCALTSSASAMLLVAECLNASDAPAATAPASQASSKPATRRIDRFKDEQMAGASFEGRNPLRDPGRRSQVLDSIPIDPAAYEQPANAILAEDYAALLKRGNLLLMAGKPDLAMPIFERAYGQATDAQIPQASEAVARCLRAQDGTIGRANAWLQSIQPAVKK